MGIVRSSCGLPRISLKLSNFTRIAAGAAAVAVLGGAASCSDAADQLTGGGREAGLNRAMDQILPPDFTIDTRSVSDCDALRPHPDCITVYSHDYKHTQQQRAEAVAEARATVSSGRCDRLGRASVAADRIAPV